MHRCINDDTLHCWSLSSISKGFNGKLLSVEDRLTVGWTIFAFSLTNQRSFSLSNNYRHRFVRVLLRFDSSDSNKFSMMNSHCEQTPCEQFQLAICLHCSLRLCLSHITEHQQIVFRTVQNLPDEVNGTFQFIRTEFEQYQNRSKDIFLSIDEWRRKKIEEIEEIYRKKLQIVEAEQKKINELQESLHQQLDRHARQPVEELTKDQNVNISLLHSIQQTIEDVRQEASSLKEKYQWKIPIVEDNPMPSTPVPNAHGIIKVLPSRKNKSQNSARAPRRLIQMFSDLSSIEKSQNSIDRYIQKQGRIFRMSTLITAYLAAWHHRKKSKAKVNLLNRYLVTVRKHIAHRHNDQQILMGIQHFFFYEQIKANPHEMMTFLLQYFLNHQCLCQTDLLHWFQQPSASPKAQIGYEKAKQLATPFIQSLTAFE